MTTNKLPKKAPAKAATKSPGSARRAVIESGEFQPVTPEQQWQSVEDWYQYLEAHRDGDRPWVNEFNDAWDLIDYDLNGVSIIKRGKESKTSDSLLGALFYYVDMGFYPPPEILAALLDSWEIYKAANGRITLEEAFIGAPRKGAGNYAKRKNASFQRLVMQWNFADFLGQGLTRMQAAEAISTLRGGKPDADSILRMFRGVTSPGKMKGTKAEK